MKTDDVKRGSFKLKIRGSSRENQTEGTPAADDPPDGAVIHYLLAQRSNKVRIVTASEALQILLQENIGS